MLDAVALNRNASRQLVLVLSRSLSTPHHESGRHIALCSDQIVDKYARQVELRQGNAAHNYSYYSIIYNHNIIADIISLLYA